MPAKSHRFRMWLAGHQGRKRSIQHSQQLWHSPSQCRPEDRLQQANLAKLDVLLLLGHNPRGDPSYGKTGCSERSETATAAFVKRQFFQMDLVLSIFASMPDVTAIGFAVVGVLLGAAPKGAGKIEDKKWLRIAIVIVAVSFGAIGLWSSINQRIQSDRQNAALLAAARSAATHDEVAALRGDITSGFERMEAALIAQVSSAPTPQHRPPSSGSVPAPRVVARYTGPKLGPGLAGHIEVTQRSTSGAIPALAYGLQVIVLPYQPIQPVDLQIVCDGAIGTVSFFLAGQAMLISNSAEIGGVSGGFRNSAIIRLSAPAITSTSPLVITISSQSAVKVLSISRAPKK